MLTTKKVIICFKDINLKSVKNLPPKSIFDVKKTSNKTKNKILTKKIIPPTRGVGSNEFFFIICWIIN